MKTLVVIQARTGSTRLPGKVMMPLAGKPLLQRMVERLRLAETPTELLVATTLEPGDNQIRDLCKEIGVKCFNGHATDLLDRHYKAALSERADVIVKIPSDCPLIDPDVVDQVIGFYLDNYRSYDYVSNLHPPTWPDGQDVEVLPVNMLEVAWREARPGFEREHTTPFIWERPRWFRLGNVRWGSGLDYSMTHRWTIDYPEDYALISAIYDALWRPDNPGFGTDEILNYLEHHPEVAVLNRNHVGVNWYRNHLDALKTIHPSMTRSHETATLETRLSKV